jgi:hypothetical protein
VARDEHGDALTRDGAEVLADLRDADRIEPVGRFVEEQHAGSPQQRPRQRQALAHALRVGPHALLRRRLHLHERQHLVDAFGRDAAVQQRGVAQVVAPRDVGVEAGLLDHGADVAQGGPGDAPPEHAPHAAAGANQAGQHAQRGRLARAVGTEEADDLAGSDLERHVVDGGDAAVALGEGAGDDGVFHGSARQATPSSLRVGRAGSPASRAGVTHPSAHAS